MIGPMAHSESLGRLLLEMRPLLGLTQSDVAARMVAAGHRTWLHSTVSRVESGKRAVTVDEMVAITEIIGRRIDEWLILEAQ